MSTNVVTPPFNIWTGLDGQPLENGMIWVGVANMDAPSNPVAVFWDAALTIPAALPFKFRKSSSQTSPQKGHALLLPRSLHPLASYPS